MSQPEKKTELAVAWKEALKSYKSDMPVVIRDTKGDILHGQENWDQRHAEPGRTLLAQIFMVDRSEFNASNIREELEKARGSPE